METNDKNRPGKSREEFPGYPSYPSSEDIYNNEKETDLDPETRKLKTTPPPAGKPNEVNNMKDMSGGDLDVPGSELDDEQENIGSEDEENNFYSLGGDDKEQQEEDKTQ